jgi:hypothetical protein
LNRPLAFIKAVKSCFFIYVTPVFCVLLISIFCNVVSWQKEANDSWCPIGYSELDSPNSQISNQFQCQENCESTDGCIGIAYSHIPGSTFYCYGCTNDTLEFSANEFGFYRNPNPSKTNYNSRYIVLEINLHLYIILLLFLCFSIIMLFLFTCYFHL